MLDVSECEDYLAEVKQTAAGIGQGNLLDAALAQLGGAGSEQELAMTVKLFQDEHHPLSFLYQAFVLQGGRSEYAYAGALRWAGAEGWTIYP